MRGDHKYDADGMGMRLLSLLERGTATFAAFRRSYDNPRKRSKCWYVVQALREDGFIERVEFEVYAITDAGRDALDDMRAGFSVTVGKPTYSVRVFATADVGERV